MKCDHLQAETIVPQGTTVSLQFYPKAETDEVIAELKAHIDDLEKLNHDLCERVTENDEIRLHWEEIEQTRAENESLKAKLESVQASAYAEMVDAGMRERRLERALWLARAKDAKHLVTAFENYDYLDFYKLNIKQESARTWMTCKLRTPAEWVNIWKEVERKCLKKAEEYK